jgi:signal transduction histidine kinase
VRGRATGAGWAPWFAWAVVGLATVAVALDTAVTAAHRPLLSEATWAEHGWPLVPLAGAGCALMGALVLSRYPRQPLGWLLCAASLISVSLAAEAYSVWVLDGAGPGSPYWAHVSGWASSLLGWPAFTAMIVIFLISPDGHLLSPRWRWAAGVAVVGLALHTLGTLTMRPGAFVYGEQYGSRGVSGPLLIAGVLLVAAGLIASAVSPVLRLRRARDDARRQLLWIASSAASLAFGVVVVLVVPLFQGDEETWLAALPLYVAYLAFPLCVAVAVLRHRLFDIDLIVNRALVLALATGLVAVGYVLVVVLVGLAVGGGADGLWPSLLATAVVALAFQPLRRRVVRVADRMAFGAAAAPYEALADFSRRLGDSPDPAALLPAVADAAAHAVNASRATAVLHVAGGPDRRAVWPPFGTDGRAVAGVEMPVLDRGERLGSITVAMPAGRPLRNRETRLLADLADQAGMAFRNARLTDELSARVAQLDHRTRELTESRQRLITAGDAERSRLERSIAGKVLPHLQPLPTRLERLARGGPGALDRSRLAPLVSAVSTALEELREITRGVFPAQLARSGLEPALGSLLGRTRLGDLVVDPAARGLRLEPRVEAAVYFCVAEVLPFLLPPVHVAVAASEDRLVVTVTGREKSRLHLDTLRDRAEAVDGSVTARPEPTGTLVEVTVPAPAPVGASR